MMYAAQRAPYEKETIMSTHSSKGIALVTGASTGIGAVYADRLAKRGYDLILVARSADKLQSVAGKISSATGRNVETVKADLTRPADVQKIADRLAADTAITALINNAGVAVGGKLLDSDPNALDDMIQLNVTAFTRLAVAAAKSFAARSKGLIVNIGSVVALAPELLNGSYSGTKAYVQNFSAALKNELAGKGVTVQVVLPGATATELWGNAGVDINTLPAEWVMTTENMVDASLAGLDKGEFATIPALPNIADYEAYEKARLALLPNLSRRLPAERYGVVVSQ